MASALARAERRLFKNGYTKLLGAEVRQLLPHHGASAEHIAELGLAGGRQLAQPGGGYYAVDFSRWQLLRPKGLHGMPAGIQNNTALEATVRMMAKLQRAVPTRPRYQCDKDRKLWVCPASIQRTSPAAQASAETPTDVVRTANSEYFAMVALDKGVASPDGVVCRLHRFEQPTGVPWGEVNPELVLEEVVLDDPWDMLVIIDNQVKHSLRVVGPEEPGRPLHRDVLYLSSHRLPCGSHCVGEDDDNASSHPRLSTALPL